MSAVIDLRCDRNPRRLFARVLAEGDRPRYVEDGNLIEFACSDCRNDRRQRGEPATMVLHRFNVIGELVETDVVLRERADTSTRGEGGVDQ